MTQSGQGGSPAANCAMKAAAKIASNTQAFASSAKA
jgi:hypothetical protein